MKNKIKAPRGYKLYPQGDTNPRKEGDKILCDGGEWKLSVAKLHQPLYRYARKITKPSPPTAEACLKWLARQSYILQEINSKRHHLRLYTASNERIYEARTPLAAIRAAMRSKWGGK